MRHLIVIFDVVVDGVFVLEVAASAAQALWLHQQLTVFLFHQEDVSNWAIDCVVCASLAAHKKRNDGGGG